MAGRLGRRNEKGRDPFGGSEVCGLRFRLLPTDLHPTKDKHEAVNFRIETLRIGQKWKMHKTIR